MYRSRLSTYRGATPSAKDFHPGQYLDTGSPNGHDNGKTHPDAPLRPQLPPQIAADEDRPWLMDARHELN